MYKHIADFVSEWQQESGRTARVLDALTDASLAQPVADDHRTLGRIAWHIVLTIGEMLSKTGFRTTSVAEDAPVPATAAEIAAAYRAAATEAGQMVALNWTDATLSVEDNMYGQKWPRGMTLAALINHEIHHRGQMTVLMRQAGLKVPGIYGPSRDEWTAFGMTPPAL